ncbi:unnamed protein product [Parnassius apollo]|uniref:(apollo) hypothetical protein n=1 Tax=Parnassius apollo TaxID=110799 RepID=A0A8S3WKY4_PARAO|nr:unnamed protein product [Parnassius apollo]
MYYCDFDHVYDYIYDIFTNEYAWIHNCHIQGPFLAEIKTNLQETVNHANLDRSLYLYSGHDVNVVALWRALGFEELLDPDYGASLVLELHEEVEQDSFFVKLFYRNNTKVEIPMELNMPFCEDPCTYKRFIQHIESLIPADWEAECQN